MKAYNQQRGYVFIDLLIATVILAIALTAVIGTGIMITRSRAASDHRTMATRIIQAQFNDLQRSSFAKGNTGWTQQSQDVQDIVAAANNPANGPGNVSLSFNVVLSLAPDPPQMPATGLQGVSIVVSWNGTNGREQVTATNYFYTAEADFTGGLTYVSLTAQ